MLYAIKGNKEVCIDEREKQGYLSQGYDIYNDKLEIVDSATSKVVTYAEHKAVLDELAEAKAELEKLKKAKNDKKGSNKEEVETKAE